SLVVAAVRSLHHHVARRDAFVELVELGGLVANDGNDSVGRRHVAKRNLGRKLHGSYSPRKSATFVPPCVEAGVARPRAPEPAFARRSASVRESRGRLQLERTAHPSGGGACRTKEAWLATCRRWPIA